MTTKELKQIWNSAVVVTVTVATIAIGVAVANLEQFRAGYLQNCDMQFPNLTYARPRFPFTLIFSYKRSTHHKEWGGRHPRGKTQRNKRKTRFKREIKGCTRGKLQRSIGSSILLILLLFSHFLFIYGDVFHGWNFVLYFSLQTMN